MDITGAGALLTKTAEGSLATVPETARWTPIHLSIAVPANASVVIVARIGENSALTMVVYSDELDGIQPLFAGKSVVDTGGDLDEDRTFDISILPNGGWMREDITIVPYLAQEAVS